MTIVIAHIEVVPKDCPIVFFFALTEYIDLQDVNSSCKSIFFVIETTLI